MNTKYRKWAAVGFVLFAVCVLVFVSGCANTNPTASTSGDSGQVSSGTSGDAAGGGGMNNTGTGGNTGGSERIQYVGDVGGVIEAQLEEELSFTKVRPLYDGYVFTLNEGYDGFESYTDEVGFEHKMEEFHFYPQIADTSDAAMRFNEAMQKRLLWDYDRFHFRSVQKANDRTGTTYRAYRHGDLVSIVFVEWSSTVGDLFARAYTYVYDQSQGKFLSKKEIIARAGMQDREFSERFDAWYASGSPSVGVYDTKRIYAPGLLQMWAYDYHLPLGDWVDKMTQADADIAINAGVVVERAPEFGMFFDDAGTLICVKTKYEVKDAETDNPSFLVVPSAESASWLQEMPYPTEELEVFQYLADKVGGDQSGTQAYVVFLGNKRDPEVIKRRLAAAAQLPAMDLNLNRIISNIQSLEGEVEMYLVIPRYTNAVMGLEPSPRDWEDNTNFGPVIAIKDSRECYLTYVHRSFFSNVMLKNDVVKAVLDWGRDEGGFVDVSELVGEVGENESIPEDILEFVKNFYEPWNQ